MRRGLVARAAALLAVALAPLTAGCDSGSSGTSGGRDSGPVVAMRKSELVEAAADCALERYEAFEESARTLHDRAEAWASNGAEPNGMAAREAWLSAMAKWEEAELFVFGPAADSMQPGGQDLRNQIYSWPLVSRCVIEEQTVSRIYAEPGFAGTRINARGLWAFEYLAFYGGDDTACGETSPIVGKGTWDALNAEELAQRKADYAAAVADDVLARATELVQSWKPNGGNFRQQLVGAGSGSTTYATDQDALNAVSHAMFYMENEVKDLKLGKPLGTHVECLTPRCPQDVESPFAHVSVDHIRANLSGFRRLMQGCGADNAGAGFDDLLAAAGAQDLSDRMLQALTNTEASLDGIEGTLEDAVTTDPESVEHVYATLKTLTDLMKTEFVAVLNLELPMSSEGDND